MSEQRRYYCTECTFETVHKEEFRQHYATHSSSEAPATVSRAGSNDGPASTDNDAERRSPRRKRPLPQLIPIEAPSHGSPTNGGALHETAASLLANYPSLIVGPSAAVNGVTVRSRQSQTSTSSPNDQRADVSQPIPHAETRTMMKMVYVCPHCSEWMSTVNRFHVHMVDHCNEKAYGCTKCTYRSKWVWDVKSHIIRQKDAGDVSHQTAEYSMGGANGMSVNAYKKFLKPMMIPVDGDDAATKRRASNRRSDENPPGEIPEPENDPLAVDPIPDAPKSVSHLGRKGLADSPAASKPFLSVPDQRHQLSKPHHAVEVRGCVEISPNVQTRRVEVLQHPKSVERQVSVKAKDRATGTNVPNGFVDLSRVKVEKDAPCPSESPGKPKIFKCKKCDYR